MLESSGSQFFRTTNVIQTGADAFDKSRLIITFLTILVVTGILCSFRLVLEGKTSKEIPESSRFEFLEKFSAQFSFIRLLNRRGIDTISNLPKVPRAKFLGSDGLFSFISIRKFDSFKNPFATITSLSKFYFRF